MKYFSIFILINIFFQLPILKSIGGAVLGIDFGA